MFAGRHRWQHRIGLHAKLARVGRSEQRQLVRRRPPRFPRALSPVKTKRAHGIGIGKQVHGSRWQRGTARQIFYRCKWPMPGDGVRPHLPKSVDLPHPQSQRALLDSIIPTAGIDVYRPDLHPIFLRIADNLRRGVKAHGLRIE